MNLIEWVMNNFIFVLGAIFALVSFIGKSKKPNDEQHPSQRAPRSNPAQDARQQQQQYDSRYEEEDEEDEYEDDSSPYSKQPQPAYAAAQNEVLEQKLRELEVEKMRMERARLKLEHKAQRQGASRKQAAAPAIDSGKNEAPLSSDEIRKGIIWAEILGPPRAKQSFTRHRK
ncbi:hypothetical protein ACFSVM_17045 [Paenibacillus shunpengii]|uniref:Uncharacterized protein n=1 Tax=Paenibacillus shunpengii TaxID=2054424 RepID=A0ABW5SQW6_9BACL|nr:hypothetical protein [Paenibacillus sp. FSL H7-0326]OMC69014.1 hypothetical protein BK126_14620 [Paenibacillus sp. FSL H7-0326]